MPPHPTQGPSAYEMGSLIWLNHGAADPRRAPFPQAHFPSLAFFCEGGVQPAPTSRHLHAGAAASGHGADNHLPSPTTPCHRSICPRSWHVSPNCNPPSSAPPWDWLGAGGRATPRIPQEPAVPTSGVTLVIHITADPPPSKLEPCHRVLTPAGTASPSTSPMSRLHSSPKALTLRFSTPHKV